MSFKFELKQIIKIAESAEIGTVIGRAEYANGAPPQYLIRYKCADGRAVEAWWTEDAIEQF